MNYWAKHITDLLILASGGLFSTTVTFAALWIRARERAVRAESLLDGVRMGTARSDTTGPALDAIAEEVERIGEGQRFLTRVMSEQANRQAAVAHQVEHRLIGQAGFGAALEVNAAQLHRVPAGAARGGERIAKRRGVHGPGVQGEFGVPKLVHGGASVE